MNFKGIKKQIAIFFFFFFSFSFFEVLAEEFKVKTAEQYFLDGVYNYSKRWYTTSKEQFEALSKNYPYSEYTRDALILEMYTNYIDKEYENVEGVVEVYNKLFPNDKYADYVLFLHAMSYYVRVRDVERTGNDILSSKILFQYLVNKYPKSKFAKNAKEKITYLTKLEQFYNLTLGEYFYNTELYISAMKQYTNLLKKFKGIMLPEFEENLLCRLIEVSKTMQNDEYVKQYSKMLNKKFPKSVCKANDNTLK